MEVTKDDQIFIVCVQSHLNFLHTSGPEWAKTKIIVLLLIKTFTPLAGQSLQYKQHKKCLNLIIAIQILFINI